MKLTAELSLYPLQEDYITAIKAFIEMASANPDVELRTNAMSTQVCGEWNAVFALVNAGLQASHERFGKQVLVCKFIPGELDIAG
ncbi:YkoF family thiamine/hydroxymethylpyrimidine-binding protein [Pseudohalioglobus lutimaris]|uniref:Thiamin/hydroxymethyl pyrimidine-binding YkoF putative domain-containing protein n=1 Tax=Pseudohalioglobus lutimaris TaxID=1737061 RepID=A0A2N5X774_9GAMM|nr:YkoF family thiamine/hydroxymethylpyrimidine-binding protein [Pseudohalioglobus lutimaris]PLW70344.1 hypothetical protein C0039_03830 [Pseudohalioglobus lutimaris]